MRKTATMKAAIERINWLLERKNEAFEDATRERIEYGDTKKSAQDFYFRESARLDGAIEMMNVIDNEWNYSTMFSEEHQKYIVRAILGDKEKIYGVG